MAMLDYVSCIHEMEITRIEQHLPGYKVEDYLAKGAFGHVFQGTNERGEPVAIKRVKYFIKKAEREAYYLKMTSSSYVVPLENFRVVGLTAYIVTPLADGSLKDILDVHGVPAVATDLSFQLLEAVYHLNVTCRVIHRDIKPSNVLVFEGTKICLADFDCAVKTFFGFSVKSKIKVGTPGYMAPEVVLRNLYSSASDLFSVGAVIYELFTGQALFKGRRSILKSSDVEVNPVLRGIADVVFPPQIPSVMSEVIRTLCSYTPCQRSNSRRLLKAMESKKEEVMDTSLHSAG